MIQFFFLLITGIFLFFSPLNSVMVMALSISVWLEWSFPQLFGIRVGLVDVIVAGGILGSLGPLTNKIRQRFPLKNLILCYILISTLSYLFSPWIPFNNLLKMLWGMYKTIYVSLIFYLFYTLINSKAKIGKIVDLLIAASVFSSILALFQGILQKPVGLRIGTYAESLAFKEPLSGHLRAFGTLGHANEFAGFLILPLCISISIFILDKDYKYRKYLPFAVMIQGMGMLMSFSRGGWIGFLVSLFIIAYYTGIYKKLALYLIPLLLIPVVIVMHDFFPKVDIIPGNVLGRFISSKNVKEDDAMKPRFIRWNYYFNLSMERPLLGHGIITNEYVLEFFSNDAPSPHNTFLSVAVKYGYIAMAIITIIICRTAMIGRYIYLKSRNNYLKSLGIGVFAGFTGLFGIAGMFGSFLEETQVNILFWLMTVIMIKSRRITIIAAHKLKIDNKEQHGNK